MRKKTEDILKPRFHAKLSKILMTNQRIALNNFWMWQKKLVNFVSTKETDIYVQHLSVNALRTIFSINGTFGLLCILQDEEIRPAGNRSGRFDRPRARKGRRGQKDQRGMRKYFYLLLSASLNSSFLSFDQQRSMQPVYHHSFIHYTLRSLFILKLKIFSNISFFSHP